MSVVACPGPVCAPRGKEGGEVTEALCPVGPDGRVPRHEEREDEEALQGGADGEQVVNHHTGLTHRQQRHSPAQSCTQHGGGDNNRLSLCLPR